MIPAVDQRDVDWRMRQAFIAIAATIGAASADDENLGKRFRIHGLPATVSGLCR